MQVLRKILFPFSLLYALAVYLRNFLFDIGFLKSKTFETPTVCVGNLSVGGTGKTPMIEFLVDNLKAELKIAVLSRGYRRKSEGFILADADSSVEEIGDEPYQIYSKFKDIAVAVDANRQNGITSLQKMVDPDLILLDDAYQHRKVKCTSYILLTAFGHLYSKDWYLPTGNLRDAKSQANRASIIVVTKCPKNLKIEARKKIINQLHPQTPQRVLFSYLDYHDEVFGLDKSLSLNDLKTKNITLVTGIANPAPLVEFLKNHGISFKHLKFKDHHFFSENELKSLKQKDLILTTEKDYVRLKNQLQNLYYLPVRHRFFNDDGEQIPKEIRNII